MVTFIRSVSVVKAASSAPVGQGIDSAGAEDTLPSCRIRVAASCLRGSSVAVARVQHSLASQIEGSTAVRPVVPASPRPDAVT